MNKYEILEGFDECDICLYIIKASRFIKNFYNNFLLDSEADLNINQFSLLISLSFSTGKKLMEISKNLCIDVKTLKRNLSTLQNRNLIRTEKYKNDKGKTYFLTQEGFCVLKKFMPLWINARELFENKIGIDVINKLLESIDLMNSKV